VLSWLARRLLIAGGFVASWFLTGDSPQFGLMEMAVATLLLVFIVAVLALRPAAAAKGGAATRKREPGKRWRSSRGAP
jgi:hypothetical protein